MQYTALALVAVDSNNVPMKGVVGYITSPSLSPVSISGVTNTDGYMVFNNVPFPFSGKVQICGAAMYQEAEINVTQPSTTIRFGNFNTNPQDIILPYAVPFKKPSKFRVMNPNWKGNDCGIHLDYLPPLPGDDAPASLFVGWLYHLYTSDIRARIREDYSKQFTHIALSWIDAYDAGLSAQQFLEICQEWDNTPVTVCVFLCAKDSGMDHNVPACISFSMQFLSIAVGAVSAFCLGWEMSLFLDTQEQWELAAALGPVCLKKDGTLVYIHEQEGYMAFPLPDKDQASFWWPLQGYVHGILLQRRLNTTDQDFAYWIQDCMARLLGGFSMPPTNGIDGRMLMGVGFELNYMDQFFDGATTESGNHLGDIAIANGTDGTGNGQSVN